MLRLLGTLLIGIVVGAVARFLMPGSNQMGVLVTGLLGIVGSFVGALLAQVFRRSGDGSIPGRPAGFIWSVIGAMVVLLLAHLFSK